MPVIDLGPLRGGGEPRTVAAELQRAAAGTGFFYVMNHGVPQRTIDAAVSAAAQFFALPARHKRAVRANGRRRGFVDRDDRGGESFRWGTELPRNGTGAAFAVRNSWPDKAVPQMRHTLERYQQAVLGCARDLLRGLALGLDLREEFFLARFGRAVARGEVIYDPPRTDESGEQPSEPRTDGSCLTLRWQDRHGGLQVMNGAGAWVAVPPIPGTFVVSIGELMARWTDELFTAKPHRMAAPTGRARFVVPVSIDPGVDALIDAAEISPEPRRHPQLAARDHLLARWHAALD